MDGDRFDNITRALASGRDGTTSRRRFLAGLAGGALAAAGWLPARRTEAQVSQASCGNVICASDPSACNSGCVCCVYTHPRTGQIINSRCRPPGQCGDHGESICPPGLVPDPVLGCKTPACAPGFADCDGNPANGCETPLGTNANCGFCGDVCTGGTSCGGGGTPGVCGGCRDDGLACGNAACGTAVNNCDVTVSCGPLGGACPQGQTCSEAGTCTCPSGTCGETCALAVCPDGSCKQGATGTCTGDGDCCSGVCVDGVCQGGCVAEGGACDSGPDCCAGACVTPGGGGNQLCCASGTACGANCCADAAQVCDGSVACCTPNTCQPGQCGPHPDGCGRGLDCGDCTEPGETCGGGGTPGVCGSCTPVDPATACAGTCGTVSDGCDGTIDCTARCAGCCTLAIDSICVPGDANGACGADGEHCRICLTPDTCGGGGTPHVCGCTSEDPAITCAGKCGAVLDNCGREVECPTCGGGQICCDGICVDASNDPDNCGSCGRVCESDPETCAMAFCAGGTCGFSVVLNCCQSDDQCVNSDIDPCTVGTCDPHTLTCRHDPMDCGSGQTCCHGVCVDLSDDPANCGACGNTCTENQPCEPCPSGQVCPDRGPGCCETGTCQAGQCTPKALRICGSCATPLCDPDLGSICVDNCPPPDACHTGEGVCQFGGTCTYEPKCSSCQECDPSTGTCSASPCGILEFCIDGECVAGSICLQESGDGTLCHPDDTCNLTPEFPASQEKVCCPPDSTLCPAPALFTDASICCPAGDTCVLMAGTIVGEFYRCSSTSVCPTGVNCPPEETCAVTFDIATSTYQPGCCPAGGVLCNAPPGTNALLCCPAGDTCVTDNVDGATFERCSSDGNYCPSPSGQPALFCEPGSACAYSKVPLLSPVPERVCCPPDGVICGGWSGIELCCPAGDTCEVVIQDGVFALPRCSSTAACPGVLGGPTVICSPGENCATLSTSELDFDPAVIQTGCCPSDGVLCNMLVFGALYPPLCCPAGDTCETYDVDETTSLAHCSSAPVPA